MEILVNEKKVERAREELRKANQPITDEAVKALYLKYGGLIRESAEEVEQEVIAPKKKK